MPSLNHVCEWTPDGWKRISAEEAAKKHPGGKVSAKSGLYMCEICGQYVTLTDGKVNVRHFRHSQNDVDCPEKTVVNYIPETFKPYDHALPIKLRILSKHKFEMDLGFIQLPKGLLTRVEKKIEITPQGERPYIYSISRIASEGVTYLSVGNIPVSKYTISYDFTVAELKDYWPNQVSGVRDFAVFDADTGNKLCEDADVRIDHRYFLLKKRELHETCPYVTIVEKCKTNIKNTSWNIYEVTATALEDDAAKFFLSFRCRLTNTPVVMYPLWPVYTQSPYIIYHKTDTMFMYICGNVVSKVYPEAELKELVIDNSKLIELNCNERQQLISVGREYGSKSVLEYLYLWKHPFTYKPNDPSVQITSIDGKPIIDVELSQLPQNAEIYVKADFDGLVIIKQNGCVQEQISLLAEEKLLVDGLSYGMNIEIKQGLDIVKSLLIVKKRLTCVDDSRLVEKLESLCGYEVKLSHSVGALSNRMNEYPQARKWLYKHIRTGTISRRAILYLNRYFNNEG